MVSHVRRVHLLTFLMGQDIQCGDQAIFKQNAIKITEEQLIRIYWKLIGLQNLGTECSWIAGWWDLEGVLGKAQLVFYFLFYFCKHLLLDTNGQRKREASNLHPFGWCFYKIVGKHCLVLWGLHTEGGLAMYLQITTYTRTQHHL